MQFEYPPFRILIADRCFAQYEALNKVFGNDSFVAFYIVHLLRDLQRKFPANDDIIIKCILLKLRPIHSRWIRHNLPTAQIQNEIMIPNSGWQLFIKKRLSLYAVIDQYMEVYSKNPTITEIASKCEQADAPNNCSSWMCIYNAFEKRDIRQQAKN